MAGSGTGFAIDVKFEGSGKVDEAEDWLEANTGGAYELEFLGTLEETDPSTGKKRSLQQIRFTFGKEENAKAFREWYRSGGKYQHQRTKPVRKEKKRKGWFGWLFS